MKKEKTLAIKKHQHKKIISKRTSRKKRPAIKDPEQTSCRYQSSIIHILKFKVKVLKIERNIDQINKWIRENFFKDKEKHLCPQCRIKRKNINTIVKTSILRLQEELQNGKASTFKNQVKFQETIYLKQNLKQFKCLNNFLSSSMKED